MASKAKRGGQDPDFDGGKRKRGGKAGKDPNAPKRPLSAFFCFSNEERVKVKAKFPSYTVGQVAKELGERWKVCPNKSKFEGLAEKEKRRYEQEMEVYRNGEVTKKAPGKAAPVSKGAAKGASKAKPPVKKQKVDDDDDDDDDEEEEEEESD